MNKVRFVFGNGLAMWVASLATVVLAGIPSAGAQSWNIKESGEWETASNWTPENVPNAVDATATLGEVIAESQTISVAKQVTIGTLNFKSDIRYTVSGGNMDFDVKSGSAQINVAGAGDLEKGHSISSSISLHDDLVINVSKGSALAITGSIATNIKMDDPLDPEAQDEGGGRAKTLTVSADGSARLDGPISGSAAFLKDGRGEVVLGGTDANTFTGGTTVTSGTLALNKTPEQNAVGSGMILLNSGGTLLLENAGQIGNSTPLTLAGGTLSTGAGFEETLGALTLSSDSTISLGSAIHLLTFGAANLASWSSVAKLTVYGWEGLAGEQGSAGRILFASLPSFTSSQLANISFAGGYGSGAMVLASGELVPHAVPETRTVAAALLIIVSLAITEYARVRARRHS